MGKHNLIVAYRGHNSTAYEYLGFVKGNTIKMLRKLAKKYVRSSDYLVVGDLAACNVCIHIRHHYLVMNYSA